MSWIFVTLAALGFAAVGLIIYGATWVINSDGSAIIAIIGACIIGAGISKLSEMPRRRRDR